MSEDVSTRPAQASDHENLFGDVLQSTTCQVRGSENYYSGASCLTACHCEQYAVTEHVGVGISLGILLHIPDTHATDLTQSIALQSPPTRTPCPKAYMQA